MHLAFSWVFPPNNDYTPIAKTIFHYQAVAYLTYFLYSYITVKRLPYDRESPYRADISFHCNVLLVEAQ